MGRPWKVKWVELSQEEGRLDVNAVDQKGQREARYDAGHYP